MQTIFKHTINVITNIITDSHRNLSHEPQQWTFHAQ